ncbi:MAG: hypothetical protein ACTSQ8_25085 [Candidatus Helarchaeota archaeon]
MTELEKIQELQRISLPDEIWDYIKEFTFDWKETHRRKFSIVDALRLENCFGGVAYWKMEPKYHKWTTFPPPRNTNDIIRDEYYGVLAGPFTPPPNLVLTSICYNPHGKGGWWCGYGWQKFYCL